MTLTTSDAIMAATKSFIEPEETEENNEELKPFYNAIHGIIVVIMVTSLIGNVLALLAIGSQKKKMYAMFFNLALADVLKTVICMPYSLYMLKSDYISSKERYNNNQFICQFAGYTFVLTTLMLLLTNTAIAVDRVFATYWPFAYAKSMLWWHPAYTIILSWGTLSLITTFPFIMQHLDHNKRTLFRFEGHAPMCVFDIREVHVVQGLPAKTNSAVAAIYYSTLYLLPMLILIVCTIMVLVKLVPWVRAEKTQSKIVFSNTTANDNDEKELVEPAAVSIARTENTIIDESECTRGKPATKVYNSKPSAFKDILLRFHSSSKPTIERNRSYRSHWRAIVTMLLVSVSFILCYFGLLAYWGGFDLVLPKNLDLFKPNHDRFPSFMDIIKVMLIVLTYFNSIITLFIYYTRCTLIREQMVVIVSSCFDFLRRKLLLCLHPLLTTTTKQS